MSAILHEAAPFDLSADTGKSLGDYLGILRRRRGAIVLVSLLLFGIAVVVALALPAVYRSTATILIKEQEIPQELVRSTVTSFADERIQVISQQVMTRATLLDMVDKYGLYGKSRQTETSEEILDRMRRDIKLTPISADVTDRRTGSPVKSTIAFTLSYDSEVAANAQKIANELTTLFLNENVKNRQQKAAETTSFIDEELARVSAHISTVEEQLAAFKRRNLGKLPDTVLSNQVGSERAATEIQRLDREMAFLEERRSQLLAQLSDTKPNTPMAPGPAGVLEPEDRLTVLQTQLAMLSGVYSDEHPDVKRLRREIARLQADTDGGARTDDRETRLTQLQAQLAVLRQKYSDDHPDVVRMKRSVAALETSIASGTPAETRPVRKADNPAYITLKSQVEVAGSQLQSMRAERQALVGRLTQLDARVNATPEVEREFLELARDLETSRTRFRELRDKQMQAQVAEQLERGRKAERFTLIEPPVFPEKPYRPNRSVIVLMGGLLALVGGLAAAALREAIDQTVHTPKDAMRLLRVPVLAIIPAMPVAARVRRRLLRRRLGLAAAVLALAGVVAALHLFYMPVDVAWYGLLRRIAP